MPENHPDNVNPYVLHCGYLNKSNCPPPGTVYDERVVKWYEIELILWGEGYILTEGHKIKAEKGSLFFRKPGMVVRGFSPYYCYLIVFDMHYDPEKAALYKEPDFMHASGAEKAKSDADFSNFHFSHAMNIMHVHKYEELFGSIYHEYLRHGTDNQFFLKTYLLQILLLTYSEHASSSLLNHSSRSIRQNYPRVLEIKKRIDSNIGSRFKLNELADAAGLSPNFFCRIFRDIVGETLVDYINKSRINLAKKLLNETNASIKAVSYECGFENDAYFYTLFKKLSGLSPSEYREKQRLLFQKR